MDTARAMEIFESKETFKVMLGYDSVWIENVDADNGTAAVMVENNPIMMKIVPCDRLREVNG